MNEKFYTPEQLAEMLEVHVKTVYRWIQDKKLGAIKFGRRNIRISRENLDEFLDNHKTK